MRSPKILDLVAIVLLISAIIDFGGGRYYWGIFDLLFVSLYFGSLILKEL